MSSKKRKEEGRKTKKNKRSKKEDTSSEGGRDENGKRGRRDSQGRGSKTPRRDDGERGETPRRSKQETYAERRWRERQDAGYKGGAGGKSPKVARTSDGDSERGERGREKQRESRGSRRDRDEDAGEAPGAANATGASKSRDKKDRKSKDKRRGSASSDDRKERKSKGNRGSEDSSDDTEKRKREKRKREEDKARKARKDRNQKREDKAKKRRDRSEDRSGEGRRRGDGEDVAGEDLPEDEDESEELYPASVVKSLGVEELGQMYQAAYFFEHLSDSNNQLTMEEVGLFVRAIGGEHRIAQEVMAEFDMTGRGLLDMSEFLEFMQNDNPRNWVITRQQMEFFEEVWDYFDSVPGNVLTFEQFREALKLIMRVHGFQELGNKNEAWYDHILEAICNKYAAVTPGRYTFSHYLMILAGALHGLKKAQKMVRLYTPPIPNQQQLAIAEPSEVPSYTFSDGRSASSDSAPGARRRRKGERDSFYDVEVDERRRDRR